VPADSRRPVPHERIGIFAHRADDHDDLIALLLSMQGTPRGSADFLSIGNTGAAEFLDD